MSGLPLFEERPESRLERAFREFDTTRPDVYATLVRLARRAKERGRARYGIAALVEIARWEHLVENRGDEFLLNNNLRAYYARAIMDREPDLAGFFETRVTEGEREDKLLDEDGKCGPTEER